MEQTNEPTTQPRVEQSAVAQDPVVVNEAKAFETYVNANNVQVPANFKSAGDWFNALKSAQSEYTKARQEISELKKQIPAQETKAQEQPVEPVPQIPEELRIPDKQQEQPVQAAQNLLTQEEWTKYATEFTVNGDLTPESRNAIKAKLNVPDFVIDDFMQGQKARLQQAYGEAANRVGGKDTLARVFDWASKNLSKEEQATINASLATPSWEVTLLGLKSKYDTAQSSKVTANEPARAGTKVGVSATNAAINNLPYSSKAEFYTERSDQRFKSDPKFRQAVELRMSRTNFNLLR